MSISNVLFGETIENPRKSQIKVKSKMLFCYSQRLKWKDFLENGKGDVRVKKESDEWVAFLQVTPLGCAMPTVDGQEVSPSVNPSPVEIPSLSLILQWLWSTDQPLGRLELSIPASLDTNLSIPMVTWQTTKENQTFSFHAFAEQKYF